MKKDKGTGPSGPCCSCDALFRAHRNARRRDRAHLPGTPSQCDAAAPRPLASAQTPSARTLPGCTGHAAPAVREDKSPRKGTRWPGGRHELTMRFRREAQGCWQGPGAAASRRPPPTLTLCSCSLKKSGGTTASRRSLTAVLPFSSMACRHKSWTGVRRCSVCVLRRRGRCTSQGESERQGICLRRAGRASIGRGRWT